LSKAIAIQLARQTGLAMLGLSAEAIVNMNIATAIRRSFLAANVILVLTPFDTVAQSVPEKQQPTGEDSSRPTVTLTAQEAYKIELNAKKVVAPYCQAKREGKSSSEAFDRVLSRVQYVPEIPMTTQQTRIFDFLKSEIAKCGALSQAAAINLGCAALTQRQMVLIARGKFVRIWRGDCLMIFNGSR
jgi:hypothetical protein